MIQIYIGNKCIFNKDNIELNTLLKNAYLAMQISYKYKSHPRKQNKKNNKVQMTQCNSEGRTSIRKSLQSDSSYSLLTQQLQTLSEAVTISSISICI